MVATIVQAARFLHVGDALDGTLRVAGHSLRATGAQGLISIGWRADAVQLQGRWESECVRRYTRGAALHAPTELDLIILRLTGLMCPPAPPSSTEPEPADAREQTWVQNIRSPPGIFHLTSATPGKARCGWKYGTSGLQSPQPPPGYHLCCKQCVPAHYHQLKADARLGNPLE